MQTKAKRILVSVAVATAALAIGNTGATMADEYAPQIGRRLGTSRSPVMRSAMHSNPVRNVQPAQFIEMPDDVGSLPGGPLSTETLPSEIPNAASELMTGPSDYAPSIPRGETIIDAGTPIAQPEPVYEQPNYGEPIGESLGTPVEEYPIEQYPIEQMPAEPFIGAPVNDLQYQTDLPAYTYSTNDQFRTGYWYSQQELVMLLRAGISDETVALAFDGNGNILGRISTKQADFTYEAGTRLTIGKMLGRDVGNRDHAVEFSFLGFLNYRGSSRLDSVGTTLVDSVLGEENLVIAALGTLVQGGTFTRVEGFFSSDQQSLLYETDFNNFELNYRVWGRPRRDRLTLQPNGEWVRHGTPSRLHTLLAGLRITSIAETMTYSAVTANPELNRGDYTVKTNNDMIGVQIGLEHTEKHAQWSWGMRGKVGGLVNFADRQSLLNQVVNADLRTRDESIRDETLVFVAEGGLFGTYQYKPNLSFRLGYDFMYYTGIATAAQNLSIPSAGFGQFSMGSDAFFHGMSLGFEMNW